MMSVSRNSILVQLAVVLFFVAGSDAASCLEKLPVMSKYVEARTTCITKLQLNASAIPEASELKERRFIDRCVSNCSLESLTFLKNGTFQKDKILETLKQEASSEVYDKLAKAVDTCIEEANKKPEMKDKKGKKDKKDTKDNKENKDGHSHGHGKRKHGKFFCTCKRAAKFMYCMVEQDEKLC